MTVGSYTPPDENGEGEAIDRGWYSQGFIYKNDRAFYEGAAEGAPQEVCYIPELDDATYTYIDFLEMCDGQTNIAEELYEAVDWQHPETLLDEWFDEGEVDHCPACGKLFDSYWAEACPYCGAAYRGKGLEE